MHSLTHITQEECSQKCKGYQLKDRKMLEGIHSMIIIITVIIIN